MSRIQIQLPCLYDNDFEKKLLLTLPTSQMKNALKMKVNYPALKGGACENKPS